MQWIRNAFKNRPIIASVATTLLSVVLLAACGIFSFALLSGPMIGSSFDTAMMAPPPLPAFSGEADGGGTGINEGREYIRVGADQQAETGDGLPQQRVILRDANLRIVVEDTAAAQDAISTLAEDLGGWVVSANTQRLTNAENVAYSSGTIIVRVPSDQLDSVLETIRGLALEIENEQVSGRDVTEEYVDLSSRLTVLESTETTYLNILDSAETVEDVLAVQQQLSDTRQEIEVIEGRLRFFDQSAAFSSVTVNIRERVPSIGDVQVAGWNPGDTLQNAFGTLVRVGQFAVDAAIMLVIVGVPSLLLLSLVIVGLRRGWRLLRRGRAAA